MPKISKVGKNNQKMFFIVYKAINFVLTALVQDSQRESKKIKKNKKKICEIVKLCACV